jgi:lipopolysaccharide/colanic/teichoic acid biosynthesis glycosyltransferase
MSSVRRPGYPLVKRGIDVVVSAVGLLCAAPVMAAVAIAVRRDLGSPVLFRQRRPGLHGQSFELVKFRTMRSLGAQDGVANDAERLTPFGRWLRSTSLDELPTLVNVLKGDMSLVGPRPLLTEYGRNDLSRDEKFAADVQYVDGIGPAMDLRVLVATLAIVLRRQGISAPGAATMHLFTGTRPPTVDAPVDDAPAPAPADGDGHGDGGRGPAVDVRSGADRPGAA